MARRRRSARSDDELTYLYKQEKYGRISKYGITNDPWRRARENANDGYGEYMEVIASGNSRSAARRAESYKIRSYARRYGSRPWGNKTW